MTAPEHGTVGDNSQGVMYTVLSGSTYVTDITKNIYDGDPQKIAKKYGIPYIIISPPRVKPTKISQVKWANLTVMPLTYRCKQESVLRDLDDAIVKTLIENEDTFISNNMVDLEMLEPVDNFDIYGDGRLLYGFTRDVVFEVFTKYYP